MTIWRKTFPVLVLMLCNSSAWSYEPIPPNTIQCSDFKRMPNGDWFTKKANFDLGNMTNATLTDMHITRSMPFSFSDMGLYDVLELKCRYGVDKPALDQK